MSGRNENGELLLPVCAEQECVVALVGNTFRENGCVLIHVGENGGTKG